MDIRVHVKPLWGDNGPGRIKPTSRSTALMATAAIKPFIQTHSVGWLWLLTVLGATVPERINLLRRRREGATLMDRGSHLLFIPFLGAGIAVLVLAPKVAPGAVIQPTVVPFVLGEVIFLGGIILRLWAIRTLGEYFTTSVQTSADQQVITSGPYRFLRHPSYTGILLYGLGAGLVVGNWIGLIAMPLITLVPLVYRIHVEEDALSKTLGEVYRSYATGHKRLIPGIW